LRIAAHELHGLDKMNDAKLSGVPALAKQISVRLAGLRRKSTPDVRAVRREFSRRLAKAPAHVVIELAQLLMEEPNSEFRIVAYELLYHHPSALSKLHAWELKQLAETLDSWWTVDMFAIYLAGPVWRERHVPDSLIRGWARSDDRWWRRAALVSTVPLNSKARGGRGDTRRTLEICLLLQRDRDPMVAKAMSWALRELSKRDPKASRRFVAQRRAILAPLVVREVHKKLTTGRKNPRRK
jgi:3-methyladenine DNA glycosylase AlkD